MSNAQIEDYKYKRQLTGITESWHNIVIPTEMYAYCNQNLTDLRIYGIRKDGDTIEVPYLLKVEKDQIKLTKIAFEIINQTASSNAYFYTFKMSSNSIINQIELNFAQRNFDWRVTLEGSQNQMEWFKIEEDYRILSIQNNQTDYKFTTLEIPKSRFNYYRLQIKAKERPELELAYFTEQKIVKGEYRNFKSAAISQATDKDNNRSQFEIQFDKPIRGSQIEVFINEEFDYYRTFSLSYLKDSLKTERGYKKIYSDLVSGSLSSLESNTFKFENTTYQQLQLSISNGNNTPLNLDSILVKSPVHNLKARFIEDADYYLVYGKTNDYRPTYDITRFQNKIPKILTPLILGDQVTVKNISSNEKSSLFENPNWLYGVMAIIILVLGWFSIKMIKSTKSVS